VKANHCEQCGRITNDWRDTGFFCSDECKARYIDELVSGQRSLQEPLVTRLEYIP